MDWLSDHYKVIRSAVAVLEIGSKPSPGVHFANRRYLKTLQNSVALGLFSVELFVRYILNVDGTTYTDVKSVNQEALDLEQTEATVGPERRIAQSSMLEAGTLCDGITLFFLASKQDNLDNAFTSLPCSYGLVLSLSRRRNWWTVGSAQTRPESNFS
jgi:hypothetical protein